MSSLFNQSFLTLSDDLFVKKPLSAKKDVECFQDEFELKYSIAARSYLTDMELAAIVPGSAFIFDSESYVNYWLVAFKHVNSGKYVVFENISNAPLQNMGKLRWMFDTFLCIGFNSKSYDNPIVSLALEGFSPKQLKQATNSIIFGQLLPYQIEQHYKINLLQTNQIDLIEVAPLQGSLKLYAGRLHCKRMQDMPIEHDAVLTDEQIPAVKDYCLNDLDNTESLFKFLYPQLELRYDMSNLYSVDLRSKSDAQIAEAVIAHELKRISGIKPERPRNYSKYFFYQVPKFITYNNYLLNAALQLIRDTPFTVGENGKVQMPEAISDFSIKLGNCVYRMGMGGLHSSEKTASYKATKDLLLIDRDIASCHPRIILNQQLYPKHLGKEYLKVYEKLVDERIKAKKSGDKVVANCLKIVLNGLFGKFGNKWSIVYSPDVMIQITISSQLCLLKLIEMIEEAGIPAISANTDGVVVACPTALESALRAVVKGWESLTDFETEETRYKALYSRDVNNYIAVTYEEDNQDAFYMDHKLKMKVKGCYAERGSSGDSVLSKNPETLICNDAVMIFLKHSIPVEETIRNCKDIRRFVVVRNVKGGATKSGKYLGKTIRWYYSTKMLGDIRYVTSGNKVPNSDGANPLMELPEGEQLPEDLDYSRYIRIANEILMEIGAIAPVQSPQGSLFSM